LHFIIIGTCLTEDACICEHATNIRGVKIRIDRYGALKNVNFRSLAARFGRSLFNLAVHGRQRTDLNDSF
jgi:hypothetical protein